MSLKKITDELIEALQPLRFSAPVTHVYNPLIHARAAWDSYCQKYGRGTRKVLALGMNPGPFGMSQVGVPFGEIEHVRDWLGIYAPIGKPPSSIQSDPFSVLTVPEVKSVDADCGDGQKETYGTPEAFFETFFITKFTVLWLYGRRNGRNFIPEKPPAARANFPPCGARPRLETNDRTHATSMVLVLHPPRKGEAKWQGSDHRH